MPMSPEEVYRAVLAFLDQFIARSAAADIRALRERLAHEPETRRQLEASLPSFELSARQAYDAVRKFFEAEYERFDKLSYTGGPATLAELLDWMEWDGRGTPGDPATDSTSDPAQWHDWLASVGRAT